MARVYGPVPDVDVIAHRGASAYAPENTFAAYDLALAQGADVLELDVRPTADGDLVLLHDATLERTAGDPRRVTEVGRAVLHGLDSATRPPAFEQLLDRYGDRARLLVDLKEPDPSWEGRVIEALDRPGLRERVAIQSFDHAALKRMSEAAPWLPVTALTRRAWDPRDMLDDVATFARAISPWHPYVDDELVEDAGALGLAVRPWTADTPDDVERVVACGVDAVITNAPDVVVRTLRGAELAAAA